MTRTQLARQKYKLISDYQSSGKTQSAYAREAGISLTGFRYWLNKYRAKHNKPVRNNFIEIVPTANMPVEANFDIIFPNGVRINIPANSDAALLGKIIKSW